MDLKQFTTESRNPETMNLDLMSSLEIVEAMNNQDKKVPLAIEKVLQPISELVDVISLAFQKGGRLIYIGCGTSGRLGILDASECPPTFGVSPDQVIGMIAGGDGAIRSAVEGAEDDYTLAQKDLEKINLNEKDVVVGLAASGRTPYVIGGLKYAKSIGCKVGAIACNKHSEIGQLADIAIEVEIGPEVITGSTRLSAGSAQKMVLNMLSTASMVKIGKVYENLMVDVVQANEKLVVRAENIVMAATGVSREDARANIDKANGNCKVAITMILTNSDVNEAMDLLEQAEGHVRKAIQLKQG